MITYLLWSNKHQAWWRADGRGYTADQAEAGRYGEREAAGYVIQSAHHGDVSKVTCMVTAPEHYAPQSIEEATVMLFTDPTPHAATEHVEIIVEGWRGAARAGAPVEDMRQELYSSLMGSGKPPAPGDPGEFTRVELAAMVVHLIERLTQAGG